jgi:hypothetical protein
MSRYVCHFLVNLSPEHVRFPLRKLFEACQMDTIYETNDYLMAREIPGRVAFTKLVTAEVSIDITTATSEAVTLSFLVKNEELPLNPNNHCRQVFDLLRVAIAHNYDWEPINTLRTVPTPPTPQQEQDLAATEVATVTEIAATQTIEIDPNLTTTLPALSTALN